MEKTEKKATSANKKNEPVKICPACGWVSHHEDDIFCKKCGAKLSQIMTKCLGQDGKSGCGMELTYHDGRFCTNCGAPIFNVSAKELVEGTTDLISRFGRLALEGFSKFPK